MVFNGSTDIVSLLMLNFKLVQSFSCNTVYFNFDHVEIVESTGIQVMRWKWKGTKLTCFLEGKRNKKQVQILQPWWWRNIDCYCLCKMSYLFVFVRVIFVRLEKQQIKLVCISKSNFQQFCYHVLTTLFAPFYWGSENQINPQINWQYKE